MLVLQPQIYIVSNITKDAVHLQMTWKSISANGYVTYNACTTYKSDYLSTIIQMRRIGDYSLKDAELLADSPFVDIFFGMQPIQQEIENSPLEELLTSIKLGLINLRWGGMKVAEFPKLALIHGILLSLLILI